MSAAQLAIGAAVLFLVMLAIGLRWSCDDEQG
jgi:hypothetical protein